MITKAEINEIAELLVKKYRDRQNRFLVEGEKLILEALKAGMKCDILIYNFEYAEKKGELLKKIFKNIKRKETLSSKEFKKIQSTLNSQGIAGVFQKTINNNLDVILPEGLHIALENINDPGNLGTIIRNADWFGIKYALISNNCADIYNPKTLRSSAGSIFHIKFFEKINLVQKLKELRAKGYEILCADLKGKNIYEFRKSKKSIIVFSNEANGPTKELLEISDQKLTIPQKGNAESLNVASASAIILSELTKN